MSHYLESLDAATRNLINAAYPAWRGRTVRIDIATHPLDVRSYWDGGSRDYFTFVNLTSLETLSMPPQSAFDAPVAGADSVTLPIGFVCVEHSIFCGKDMGIRIHVHPDNAPMLLPAPSAPLSEDQIIVLTYTRNLKSSYAGIRDLRFHQANRDKSITREAWDTAKAALIASEHLNKAGAITARGRNAIAHQRY